MELSNLTYIELRRVYLSTLEDISFDPVVIAKQEQIEKEYRSRERYYRDLYKKAYECVEKHPDKALEYLSPFFEDVTSIACIGGAVIDLVSMACIKQKDIKRALEFYDIGIEFLQLNGIENGLDKLLKGREMLRRDK